MRKAINRFFLKKTSGAVSVDWVVLTAIASILGAAVTAVFLEGDRPLGETVIEAMTQVMTD